MGSLALFFRFFDCSGSPCFGLSWHRKRSTKCKNGQILRSVRLKSTYRTIDGFAVFADVLLRFEQSSVSGAANVKPPEFGELTTPLRREISRLIDPIADRRG